MVPSLRWFPSVRTARSRIMKSLHAISSPLAACSTSSWSRTCTRTSFPCQAPSTPPVRGPSTGPPTGTVTSQHQRCIWPSQHFVYADTALSIAMSEMQTLPWYLRK